MHTFFTAYAEELTRAVAAFPTQYLYPPDKAAAVAETTRRAVIQGGVSACNINSMGWKWTCKRLGIHHTKKAITAFIEAHP